MRANFPYRFAIIGFLLFSFFEAEAQQLWTSIEANYKATKKWKFSLEESYRTNDYLEEWRILFTEVGAKRELTDYLDVGASYRFTTVHRKNNEHRITGELKLKTDVFDSDWKVDYRFKYQYEWKVGETNELLAYRNRFGIQYKLEDEFQPYASYEHFYIPEDRDDIKYRIKFGIETELSKELKLDVCYLYQRSFFQAQEFGDEPKHSSAIKLALSYTFKRKSSANN